jgi:type I restriction enzyme R subunit
MAAALRPFLNPALRDTVLRLKQSLEQIYDESNRDELTRAGFDAAALEKARAVVTSFKQFIEDNKNEIEAIKILYSRPYRAGLRYTQVKDLAQKLGVAPFYVDAKNPATVGRLWQAFEAVEPGRVRGKPRHLVDLIELVKHAIGEPSPLVPFAQVVEERYVAWLADKAKAGEVGEFTPQQRKWLDAIKDHIAASLAIDAEALEDVPFKQMGGLGAAYEVFGESLPTLLTEMNERLVA